MRLALAVALAYVCITCTTAGQDTGIWTSTEVDAPVIREDDGPEACGWEDARFLAYGGRVYVRDPEGVVPVEDGAGPFKREAALPEGATFTGYRNGDQELWVSTEDERYIYIVEEDSVERWPAAGAACA